MSAKNNDASLVKAALENWQEKEVLKNVQYKLPDIETNPNKIYRNYIKEGLQPDKFKTKEQLFEAVKDALNKTVNGKQVSMGQALKSLFPDGYEGIPLTYSKTGSSKKGNRVIKEVMFDKRAFREQIPLEIKQWFKLNQSKGLIPADSLDKYTKYISKGNTRNATIAKRLSELTGIKFDKGHIFALFSDGTNDPAAQIAELLSENRGKGGVDNIPKNLADIIDTPKNWQQSAFEFVNRQTGGASGSGLPVDKFGKSLSDADLASIARHGANPDQVVASKWKKVFDALSEAELAKANNTIPDFVNKFSSRIDESGKYIQKFGSGKPKVKGEIINIDSKTNKLINPKNISRALAANAAYSFVNPRSIRAATNIIAEGPNKENIKEVGLGIRDDLIHTGVVKALGAATGAKALAIGGTAAAVPLGVGLVGGMTLNSIVEGATGKNLKEIGEQAEEKKLYRDYHGLTNKKSDRQNYRHSTSPKVTTEMLEDWDTEIRQGWYEDSLEDRQLNGSVNTKRLLKAI